MSKLNVENIKKMTSNKIGIDQFLTEERSRNINFKKTTSILGIVMFIFVSLASVNALTNNGIIKLFTGKAIINGKEKDVNSYIQTFYVGDVLEGDGKSYITVNKVPKQGLCLKSNEVNQEICIVDAKEILNIEMNYDEITKHPTNYTVTYIDLNNNKQIDYINFE